MQSVADWFSNNIDWTISVGDIIAVAAMGISIFMAIISSRKSKQAKKYAKDANKHNIAAKKYYDSMNEEIVEQKKNKPKEELKDKAYRCICMNQGESSTQGIASSLKINCQQAENILRELWKVDGKITTHPNRPFKLGDYKTYRWIKNNKKG